MHRFFIRGGFGDSARAGLSEGLSIRLAAVEQLEAAEDAKREQERKRRAEASRGAGVSGGDRAGDRGRRAREPEAGDAGPGHRASAP